MNLKDVSVTCEKCGKTMTLGTLNVPCGDNEKIKAGNCSEPKNSAPSQVKRQ